MARQSFGKQLFTTDLLPLDALIGPWENLAELTVFLQSRSSTLTLANLKSYHQFFVKNSSTGMYDLYQGNGTINPSLLQTDVKDSAITEAKLAASSVTESKIADSAVTTAKINTGAVTTDKIGALAVTDAKLASSSVTTDKVASGAITTAKLASEVQTTINSKASSTALSDEASRATAAETALQTAVTNEASARATAITNLSTSVTQQIAAEASARQNSDEDITTSIGTKTSSCASYSDVWAAISAVKGTADAGLHPTGGTVALTDSYDPTKGTSDSMAATPMCVADALSQTPKYTVVDSATSKAQLTTQGGDSIYPKTYSVNVLTADGSSNVETELANISAKVGELELTPLSFASTERTGYIISSTKLWSKDQGYCHYIPSVVAGKIYRITASDDYDASFAFLMTKQTPNTSLVPTWATGYSARVTIPAGEYVDVVAPSDANYLYLHGGSASGKLNTPQSLELVNEVDKIEKLKANVAKVTTSINDGYVAIAFDKGVTWNYVRHADGNLVDSSYFDASAFIDISLYSHIRYKRVKATSNASWGIAFYDKDKAYISGEPSLKTSEAGYFETLYQVAVPNGAVYARFSMYHDSDAYGDFVLFGINKFASMIENASCGVASRRNDPNLVAEFLNVARSYLNHTNMQYGQSDGIFDVEGNGVDKLVNIDCSTFVSLCLRGIPYSATTYADASIHHAPSEWGKSDKVWALDPSEYLQPKHVIVPASETNNVTWIRTAAQMAKWMVEMGWMVPMDDRLVNLEEGDIIFYAHKDETSRGWRNPTRYKFINHVAICLSKTKATASDSWDVSKYPYRHVRINVRGSNGTTDPCKAYDTIGGDVVETYWNDPTKIYTNNINTICLVCRPDLGALRALVTE